MALFTPTKVLRSKNNAPKIFHWQRADAPFPGVRHFRCQRLSSLGKAAGLWSQPIRLTTTYECWRTLIQSVRHAPERCFWLWWQY